MDLWKKKGELLTANIYAVPQGVTTIKAIDIYGESMPEIEEAIGPARKPAEGEQEYMKILAQSYGEEDRSEFYSFVRSLDALKTSMKGEDKTVILSADSPIAQIFEGKLKKVTIIHSNFSPDKWKIDIEDKECYNFFTKKS